MNPAKKYTEEEKKEIVDKIVKLRNEGMLFGKAVEMAGVPKGTVYPWIRAYAPDSAPPRRAYAPRVKKVSELIQIPALTTPRLSGDNRIILILIENIEAQLKTIKEFIRQS